MSDEEILREIGKYVDYKPTSGSFNSQKIYNGYEDQSFQTQTNLKWRILDINKNTLVLISDTTANEAFGLKDANGYNNGVKLLNDACKAMYSNSSIGAVGRSVKLEDLEAVSSYKFEGEEEDPGNNHYWYPNIFAREKTGAPRGTYGTELGLSEQKDFITGESYGTSSFKGENTEYSYTLTAEYMDKRYLELFRYEPETTTDLSDYWLATRCVNISYDVGYYLFAIRSGMLHVGPLALYTGNDVWGVATWNLRPVIEIDLGKVKILATNDGSNESPYSIIAN